MDRNSYIEVVVEQILAGLLVTDNTSATKIRAVIVRDTPSTHQRLVTPIIRSTLRYLLEELFYNRDEWYDELLANINQKRHNDLFIHEDSSIND